MQGLEDRWDELARRLGAPEDLAAAAYGRIANHYTNLGVRAYHTLEHVVEVLDVVDDLADLAGDADAVRVAAWFHDAVYEPTRHDNEEASADLALTILEQMQLPAGRQGISNEVGRLIRLTAHHEAGPEDRNGRVIADADLAILGAPPERYFRYASDIRIEYRHVPEDEYVAARRWVLSSFLERDHIFLTARMRDLLEARARANLQSELDQLTGEAEA